MKQLLCWLPLVAGCASLTNYNSLIASSGTSNASSNTSAASSNVTSSPTNGAQASSGASAASSGAVPSTIIVAASGLLLAVAGGIVTTVYAGKARTQAEARAEEFRKLHPPQVDPVPATEPPVVPALPPIDPGPVPSEPTPPPLLPVPQSQRTPPPNLDAMVMARAWLLANELQLKQDLALGAGPAIDDLAGIAGISIERRGHFGRLLQRNRSRLLTTSDVTVQQAAQVMSVVGDLVLADPLLRVDGEAMLAASRSSR